MPARRLICLASLGALAGCTSIQRSLGIKTDLRHEPVIQVRGGLARGARPLCPGQTGPLVVVADLANGQHWSTVGAPDGNVTWDSYGFSSPGATVDDHGNVTVSADPRQSRGGSVHLSVNVVGQAVGGGIDVPVRYSCPEAAHFDGAKGGGGRLGDDGLPGAPGAIGQPGGPGGPGQMGGPGRPGEPGDAVRVWVRLEPGAPRPLLQVMAQSATHGGQVIYLIDPAGGSLTLTANGGRGGPGGLGGGGGPGGAGGPEASGAAAGAGGPGGDGGQGGAGGPGGVGGSFQVTVSPEAQPYLGALRFVNAGGESGAGGGGGSYGAGGKGVMASGASGHNGRRGQSAPGRAPYGPRVTVTVHALPTLF